MFLDDTYVNYRARVNYSLLDAGEVNALWAFFKKNGIRMPFSELKEYAMQPDPYKYAFIAKIKNEIVGFILFTDLESELFINHLFVAPVHRFKGIGTTLMAHAKELKPIGSFSYLDASTNFMPWMDVLSATKRAQMITRLGSFYKPKPNDKPEEAVALMQAKP
ncbi:GNAT family N-acetyltransferase [Legionella shakespearei]|uniref:Putative Acetyltransferase n=1 Tax=Legionella shakespearei DSM 23087 TaxID=1122169 RepID=A0A0W0Z8G7_9GAMM|nr:GNAT family N-acetyltransferase [Legionella shakespearei]KTD65214.1 putative Acetyltransferase [Legionella shakespearei DSM 23087]